MSLRCRDDRTPGEYDDEFFCDPCRQFNMQCPSFHGFHVSYRRSWGGASQVYKSTTPSLLKPSIYCILASVDAVRGILSTPLLNCIDSNSLDSMLHLSTVSIDLEFAANVQLVAAWNHQTKDAPATCRISSSTGNGWSMALVFRESAAMIP